MSEELINRIAEAIFDEHNRGLRESGFKSLVRENPDVHDMVTWRRYARAVVSELDLTDEDVNPSRIVISFWRFNEALRRAREDAWDKGLMAWSDYERSLDYIQDPDVPSNPYSL